MILEVELLTPTAKVPFRANKTDAGFDIYADEDVTITAGDVVLIATGIAVHPSPELGADLAGYNETWTYACLCWDKSGRGKSGLKVLGGVIDDPYTGEVGVLLANIKTMSMLEGIIRGIFSIKMPFITIRKGEKLCNFIVQRVELPRVVIVDKLRTTERGAGGFGSTGLT